MRTIFFDFSRAIAMMFIRLSVCQSVWDGRALWSYGAR